MPQPELDGAVEASVRDYAYPVLGDMHVAEIGSRDVLQAFAGLRPIKRETRHRSAGPAMHFGGDELPVTGWTRPGTR